jgi:putative membrane protein
VTVLRLARSELKRMTGGLLPKLTILALTMVPLLYGAVYLYANWDPYGNLDHLDAALVVEDTGATASDGTQLAAGTKVADSLVEGNVFHWVPVASTEEADQGVSDGEYAFALKIPEDFSANLVSPGSFDSASQAMLNVTTNDANNYLLSTIVDKLTTSVHSTVATEVGEETANQLLTGFGTIHTRMVQAADGAGRLADGVVQLRDGATGLQEGTSSLSAGADDLYAGQLKLRDGANQLTDGAGQLSSGLSVLKDKTASLPTDTQTLATGAAQVAAGNAQLNAKFQDVAVQLETADQGLRTRVIESNTRLVAAGALTQEQADSVLADFDATAASSPVAAARPRSRRTPPRSSNWLTVPSPSASAQLSSPPERRHSRTPSSRRPAVRSSCTPVPPHWQLEDRQRWTALPALRKAHGSWMPARHSLRRGLPPLPMAHVRWRTSWARVRDRCPTRMTRRRAICRG